MLWRFGAQLFEAAGVRPWQGQPLMQDAEASAVFDSLAKIAIDNERRVLFSKDRWIAG